MYIIIKLLKEEWKDIIDKRVQSIYEISNYGEVKNKIKNKVLKPFTDKDGYHRVSLQGTNGKKQKFFVHRLVAIYFIPNPDNKPEVNHLDAKRPFDDFVGNLEWSTRKENIDHSWNQGLQNPVIGEQHGANVYSEELIHEICKLLEKGFSNFDIRLKLNLITQDNKKNESFRGLIKHLKRGTAWKHIVSQYNFNTQ